MKLEQSFDVDAPIDEVWSALIDVARVAPCLPGAAVSGRNEDGTYNGSFTVKIGPTTASYSGKLEMESMDEQAHTAVMQAQGSDRRGQGGAKATIVSKLTSADGGGTHVEVDTDYHITGRLARFGRGGMIEDISERLLREFAGRLQASLAGGGGAGSGAAGPPVAHEQAPRKEGASEAAGPDGAEEAAGDEIVAATGEPHAAAGGKPHAAAESEAASAPSPAAPPPPPAEPPPAAEPLQAAPLIGSVLADRVKRNPAPLIAGLIFGFMLVSRRRRRRRHKRRAREQSEQ
jgi:carbon monoxide dehydrogenase subunit G